MTKIGRETVCVVVCLFIVAGFIASATRFEASAAPPGEGPRPDAKPPAVKTATCPEGPDKGQGDKESLEARAVNTKAFSFDYRHRRMYRADSYEDSLIGGLVDNYWWMKSLPLVPAQANAIKKLDELVRDANDHATLVAADYMDTNPPDYQEFADRFDRRLHETLRRGERMTAVGLLTEPQAAFVMQRYLSGSGRLYGLRDKNVQDLLGMTASQNKELDKVGEAANRREALLNLWSVDPIEQEYNRTVMIANEKRMNEEALKVLTPSQRKVWDGLTAERSLPAKSPEMAAPSEAEAARIKIEDVSPVFRVLAEKADAFKLSDSQKKLLNRLKEITREGLFWIRLRNSKDAVPADRASQASAEFVKQAEQVALFGILTEKQAEQVESATKE